MINRILLAEDNFMNQKLALLGLKNFDVDLAKNGEEAVELFAANRYDMVLMDIQMPRLDGIEATRKIRAHEEEKQLTPSVILALTADWSSSLAEECEEAGMNGYLPKPFNTLEMADLVEEFYRKYATTTTN